MKNFHEIGRQDHTNDPSMGLALEKSQKNLLRQLTKLRVNPQKGRESFRETLNLLQTAQLEEQLVTKMKKTTVTKMNWFAPITKFTSLVVVFILIITGGLLFLDNAPKQSVFTDINMQPNGSLENLNNLNTAEASSDSEYANQDSVLVQTAESSFESVQGIGGESINEDDF